MSILINAPSLILSGGVASHYSGLRPFWTLGVKYNYVGGRYGIPGPIILIFDYVKFFFLCAFRRYSVIVLNPSLGKTAIYRDSVFLYLAKIFSIKVVVFFHGWDRDLEKKIDRNPASFRARFYKADAFIVLAQDFSDKLRDWGIDSPIYLSSTKVDDRLIERFDIDKKVFHRTILFLARLEANKGIFQSLSAFSKLLDRYPDSRFIVAGSGSAMDAARAAVESGSISNVEFLGNVSGDSLVKAFSEADVYLLPTSHGEGMPTSVLEAMAFGLPVITRPVGGLKDFFEDGKMGFISDSLDPDWYADAVHRLFSDPSLTLTISHHNHHYAKEHFMASKVAKHLEEIFERV